MEPGSFPRRRTIRYKGYDYTSPGWYFITLCTYQRQNLLGYIIDGKTQLSEFGKVAKIEWELLPLRYSFVRLDCFSIMPNHFHGIIEITGDGNPSGEPIGQFGQSIPGSLGTIMGSLKSSAARKINVLRKSPGVHVWQDNYYEHIIRSQADYLNIQEYVYNNPLKWELDEYWKNR